MSPDAIAQLLREVAAGTLAVPAALERLRHLPFEDLEFARVDHMRELRQGAAEVIYGAGKTPEQIAAIAGAILAQGGNVLCTRASRAAYEAVRAVAPDARHDATAAAVTVVRRPPAPLGSVGVLCAGTSDVAVAEEAAVTAAFFGAEVVRLYDVGVAGLHRLLEATATLARLDVAIVVAGMEGALPSVVGGIIAAPVIAVPTSVGYGASFGGLTALLAMLNSCASGVTVVNIDNGFGAAAAAHRILRARHAAAGEKTGAGSGERAAGASTRESGVGHDAASRREPVTAARTPEDGAGHEAAPSREAVEAAGTQEDRSG